MDVADYIGVFRRRWLAVVACAAVGVLLALALITTTPKTYRSSARLFVNVPAARGVQEALQGVQLTSGLLRSYAEVATSRAAAERVIAALGLDLSPGALTGKLSASTQDDTLLITISATDEDPAVAQRLAAGTASVFTDIVEEFERGRDEKIEARLIDPATKPSKPTQPKPRRNLALGLLGGLGLGAGLALALEAVDRTVKSSQQASLATGGPLLAVVPRRRNADALALDAPPGDVAAEAFRSLRTSVRFLRVDGPARTILLTSPSTGEGKTTTAASLAVAFAQSGARVVVVDADLRRARLGALFDAEGGPGLTSVLTGEACIDDALVPWSANLRVLPAGALRPNPAELVGSRAMARVLRELEDDAGVDVVIVDAPPVIPVTDAVALATQVQGVVMVVRAGRTRRDAVHEAVRRLEVVGAEVIGCVLNAAPRSAEAPYAQDHGYLGKKP